MSLTEKILAGVSAICLLFLGLQSLLISMNMAETIDISSIAVLAVFGLGVLTTATTLVASYRQIPRPRPVLVWCVLGLQIVFTSLLFASFYVLIQDEEYLATYNMMRESAIAGTDQAAPGYDVDDVFPPIHEMISLTKVILSYLYVAVLMVIPVVRSIIYPRRSS